MSTHLNEDQIAIQDTARRFAKERLTPHYIAREAAGTLDMGLVKEMGDLGLIGVDLPEKHGGLGADGVTSGVVIEAWSQVFGSFGAAV